MPSPGSIQTTGPGAAGLRSGAPTSPGPKPGRILRRIVYPFVFLFAAATIFYWLLSAYFLTRFLDQSLQNRMQQVASIISRSGFALNPNVLLQLKEVTGADIVVFDREGEVLRSTFADAKIEQEARSFFPGPDLTGDSAPASGAALQGTTYRMIFHPVTLPSRDPALLSLWVPSRETDYLKRTIVLGMAAAGLLGLLIMAAAGYLIARSITAPVEELAATAAAVASGDLARRARVFGRDEIGLLAGSFNEMIERLLEYEQKLVESEKLAAAGQVAAGLAHEIRNPLTSIKMLGEVLYARMKHQSESREMLGSMIREIGRLDRTIEEMLARARPREFRIEPENLNSQVEAVLDVARENLDSRDISVSLDLDPDLPEVDMDTERIRQVLWNLLLNAMEAMPDGGLVTVSTRRAQNGFIEAAVDDEGGGIAPGDDPERFFRPFYTTRPEGMGMGLSVSRKIIEQHGGRLGIENRAQGGARASFTLPATGGRHKVFEEDHA